MLLYRDKLVDGELTEWRNGWAVTPNAWSWIWSPQARQLRTVERWFQPLISLAEGEIKASHFFLSRIYVSAALHVSGLERTQWSECRQFMIARIGGFDRVQPAQILFVSPLFRLDEEP
jgi:hypothetical protein